MVGSLVVAFHNIPYRTSNESAINAKIAIALHLYQEESHLPSTIDVGLLELHRACVEWITPK